MPPVEKRGRIYSADTGGAGDRIHCCNSLSPGTLLKKIEVPSNDRSRIVRSRFYEPIEAWGDKTDQIPSQNGGDFESETDERSRVQKSHIISREGQGHRTSIERKPKTLKCGFFTRVTAQYASKENSCTPTVVEPFRSMETHVAYWKRKMTQHDERQLRERHEQELVKEKERERFLLAMRYGKAFRGVISRSTEMQHRRQRKILKAEATVEKKVRECSKFKARPVHLTGGEDWESIQQKRTAQRGHQRPGPPKSSMMMMSNEEGTAGALLGAGYARRQVSGVDQQPVATPVARKQGQRQRQRQRQGDDGRCPASAVKGKVKTLPSQMLAPAGNGEELLCEKLSRKGREINGAYVKKKDTPDRKTYASDDERRDTTRAIDKTRKDGRGASREANHPRPAPRPTRSSALKAERVDFFMEKEREQVERDREQRRRRNIRQLELNETFAQAMDNISREQCMGTA